MEREADGQAGQIRRLVTAHLPGYRVRSIARLAEGQENVAYEVNGELIVRFSKEPDPVRRGAIGAFLAAPPPPGPGALVFSHNDLGIEHVLADPRTWAVTGVLDWGDAAITDPAYDIGLLYRDLGPAALDAVIGTYPAG